MTAFQGAPPTVGRLQCDKSLEVSYFNQPGNTALSFAIMQGSLPPVRELLRRHDIDVNGQIPRIQPPILVALEYQQYKILKILLEDPRLDIAIQDSQGHTALHLAVIYGDPVAVRLLLGNEKTDVNHLDYAGNSALLLASMTYDGWDPKRNVILDLLVSNPKTSVNVRDQRGRSVLWHAANTSNERLILQLAQLPNLELETPDGDGVTPLGQARKRGNIKILALLQNLVSRTGTRGLGMSML